MYAILEASFAQWLSHLSSLVLRIETTNGDPVTIFKTMTYPDKTGDYFVNSNGFSPQTSFDTIPLKYARINTSMTENSKSKRTDVLCCWITLLSIFSSQVSL